MTSEKKYTITKDRGLEFTVSVPMGMGKKSMDLIRLERAQGKKGFYSIHYSKKFRTIKQAAEWLAEQY